MYLTDDDHSYAHSYTLLLSYHVLLPHPTTIHYPSLLFLLSLVTHHHHIHASFLTLTHVTPSHVTTVPLLSSPNNAYRQNLTCLRPRSDITFLTASLPFTHAHFLRLGCPLHPSQPTSIRYVVCHIVYLLAPHLPRSLARTEVLILFPALLIQKQSLTLLHCIHFYFYFCLCRADGRCCCCRHVLLIHSIVSTDYVYTCSCLIDLSPYFSSA